MAAAAASVDKLAKKNAESQKCLHCNMVFSTVKQQDVLHTRQLEHYFDIKQDLRYFFSFMPSRQTKYSIFVQDRSILFKNDELKIDL